MPFITITYPPKYPLTKSEKKWLHERKNVKGWAFCLHCPPGKKGFPCSNWLYHFCPTDGGQDFKTAAEFEARVAALLSINENRLTPCLTDLNPETRGECKQWRFYWRNSYAVYWGCAACRLKYARLAVEEEMQQ